jgi:epoxyqueuosine reductase
MQPSPTAVDRDALKRGIVQWGRELGFQAVGITHVDLREDEAALARWLALGRHGDMDYMARHGEKRSRPEELVPGTLSVISVRMDYLPTDAAPMQAVLDDPDAAYVSRYALGRDYHKVLRQRLQKLADRIRNDVGDFGHRVFTDSAPVLEKPLARNAGLGWIGKHTNLIDSKTGSWFFLGELYTDLPLAADTPAGSGHCGTCRRCIDACPTGAIVAPYELDARLCISYLTIELHGAIPEPLRPLIGNRIYGCDDCQMVCPWNKFAQPTREPDFAVRHGLDRASLIDVFAWTEDEFLTRTEGSPIRRIGHERWLRNVAVALGNAPTTDRVVAALCARRDDPSSLVREHVEWALARHKTSQLDDASGATSPPAIQ